MADRLDKRARLRGNSCKMIVEKHLRIAEILHVTTGLSRKSGQLFFLNFFPHQERKYARHKRLVIAVKEFIQVNQIHPILPGRLDKL